MKIVLGIMAPEYHPIQSAQKIHITLKVQYFNFLTIFGFFKKSTMIENLLKTAMTSNPPTAIHIRQQRVHVSPNFLPKYGKDFQPVYATATNFFPRSSSTIIHTNFAESMPMINVPKNLDFSRNSNSKKIITQRASSLLARSLRLAKIRQKQIELMNKWHEQENRRFIMRRRSQLDQIEEKPFGSDIEDVEKIAPKQLDQVRKMKRIAKLHGKFEESWEKRLRIKSLSHPVRKIITVPYKKLKDKIPPEPSRIDPIKKVPTIFSKSFISFFKPFLFIDESLKVYYFIFI